MNGPFPRPGERPSALASVRPLLLVVAVLLLGGHALATSLPYDERADAALELRQALLAARASQRPVLLIFGANWCPDCRALDAALQLPATAALLAREFVVVKVDVGNFDRNLALAARYGNPIKKGIPAAAVLSPDDQLLYATRAGELSSAKRMSARGIQDFFSKVASLARKPVPG